MNNRNDIKSWSNQWLINNVIPAKGTGVLYGDCDEINTLFAYRIATCLSCNSLDLTGRTEKTKKVLYMGSKNKISTFNFWLSGEGHVKAIKSNLSFCETDELVKQHRAEPISNLLINMSNFMQFSGNKEYPPLIILDLSDQAFGDMNGIKQATRLAVGANFLQKHTGSTVLLMMDRNMEGFTSILNYSDFAIKSMTLDEPKCLGIRCTHMNDFIVMPPACISDLNQLWGV